MCKSTMLCLGALSLAGAAASRQPVAQANVPLDAEDVRVVKEVERVIRRRITVPGKELELKIVPTSRASEGYFEEISIKGAPAKLKRLHVSEFSLNAKKVRIDVGHLFKEHKIRTLSTNTTFRAVVTEDDLTATLGEGKRTRSMGLKVKYLSNSLVRVTGNLNMSLVNGPIDGTAKLRMAPGHQVFLDIQSLKLRGSEVPQFVKDRISSSVNPIVDYDELPFSPPFKGVKVEGKKATVFT